MRVLSPRIDPPVRRDEGSTASTATLAARVEQMGPECVDRGRFADARRARDADADRPAGCGKERLHKRAGCLAVVGALAFDERDRARQGGALAGAHRFGEGVDVGGKSQADTIACGKTAVTIAVSRPAESVPRRSGDFDLLRRRAVSKARAFTAHRADFANPGRRFGERLADRLLPRPAPGCA